MQKVLINPRINKIYSFFITAFYIIFCITGYYFGNYIVAGIGIVSAFLIDLFSPRWYTNLNKVELRKAIINMLEHGCNGGELIIKNFKQIKVYRDNKEKPYRVALVFQGDHALETGEKYLKSHNGFGFYKVKFTKRYYFFPSDKRDHVIDIVENYLNIDSSNVINVLARTTCSTKDIFAHAKT